jgi:hypothetical protein
MGAWKEMSLALEKALTPAVARPENPPAGETRHRLDVFVVFTSVDLTLQALKQAGALAERLDSRITLVVPQVVPFPLPLTSPPVLLEFNERRFSVLASQRPVGGAASGIEAALPGGDRRAQRMVAAPGKAPGQATAPRRPRSGLGRNGVKTMLDLIYIGVACVFLLICWAFTKACDKL